MLYYDTTTTAAINRNNKPGKRKIDVPHISHCGKLAISEASVPASAALVECWFPSLAKPSWSGNGGAWVGCVYGGGLQLIDPHTTFFGYHTAKI